MPKGHIPLPLGSNAGIVKFLVTEGRITAARGWGREMGSGCLTGPGIPLGMMKSSGARPRVAGQHSLRVRGLVLNLPACAAGPAPSRPVTGWVVGGCLAPSSYSHTF